MTYAIFIQAPTSATSWFLCDMVTDTEADMKRRLKDLRVALKVIFPNQQFKLTPVLQ